MAWHDQYKKLADLYYEAPIAEGEGSIKQVSRPVYIEGIGTRSSEKDSVVEGTGRGETGVVGRVQTSFTFIKQIIEDALQENPNSEIASITLTLSVSVEVQPPLAILQ
jgi:hypothetical protein